MSHPARMRTTDMGANVELTGAAAALLPQRPATEGSEVDRRVSPAAPPEPTFDWRQR